MADTDPVRVLYVAGTGRSGSTLVSTVLGHLPGVFSAGELRFMWTRGLGEDQLCGCGAAFTTCPVWVAVTADLHGRLPGAGLDPAAFAHRLRRRTRVRRVPVVAARVLTGRRALPPCPDDAVLVALYRAVRRSTGTEVVVDSSKLPLYGLLLQGLPEVDLTVLHLVRDPRAAAYSWLRRRASHQRADDPPMDRLPVAKSALLWLLWNLVSLLAWPRGAGHLRLRYEAVVADPRRSLEEVVLALGRDTGDLPFEDPRTLRLGTTHAVAGNPSRRDTGAVQVLDDDEWQQRLGPARRLLVTALTAPVRAVLGYPTRTRCTDRRRATAGSGGGR